MKILNLYCGIGGNRKLWGDGHEITAIELNEDIGKIYKDNFPNDRIIIDDAHLFLLENFERYDFIWTSPPCPTHSQARKMLSMKTKKDGTVFCQNKPVYPDMKLYKEILLLKHYFKGKFVVENAISFYEPLIKPQKIGMHYFWSNFDIYNYKEKNRGHDSTINDLQKIKGFDLSKYSKIDKRKILRNCVNSELALHIFNSQFTFDEKEIIKTEHQKSLF